MNSIIYFVKQIHSYSGKGLYVNLMAMSCISLLEGIGILLLIPMISMSGILPLQGEIARIAFLFEPFEQIPSSIGLPIILLLFVMIVIAQNVLQRYITVKNTEITNGFYRYLRFETYRLILQAKWAFFVKKRKSDLINILTNEITKVGAGTFTFLQFVSSFIFTLIQISIAFWLSPTITGFVLLSGLLLLFFSRKFLSNSMRLGSRNHELSKAYLAGVTDQINGIKDIKSNTLELNRLSWYDSVTKKMKEEQVNYTKLQATSQMYYKIASACLMAMFIFFSINLFHSQGGQLLLVIVIFSRLWPRVTDIQASMEQIANTVPAFEVVKAIQHECEELKEFHKFDKGTRLNVHNHIECKNVYFSYNDEGESESNIYALHNISVRIPANKMTAVVGRSGAGKSTLIDLFMGLNKPQKGQVLVDGLPLTEKRLMDLRQSISYVPQEPFLFNETIRENLMLVAPHATEQEMWEALEFSMAADFVKMLPNQLDTIIGDRGMKLSGGERQRLVLARAILRKPTILILDEATSALDSENEKKIQEALRHLQGSMTIIVIAHRLSTIRDADQVIVLEHGHIIQSGEYAKLAEEEKGVFRHLLQNQKQAIP
ncbi:ABC transporter ATP-binding protein [Halalkalibacter sp. AB-rgal2]|uniref:ABC transporter ATP-binding protein n=1 Tax=Halalkalibacter sp. AB-rgal2 TaxID=3242695 RepID=UPI00359E79D4